MANARKRISELPPLNVASLDTTFVLGISGSTTYKISINNLTSSLDGAFATDLVTNALSSSLNSKLSTSSFNQYTASFTTSVATGTVSGSSQLTSSFDERYVLSGSITQTTWDNIVNKPTGIVSQSTDLSSLNTFTASISTASLVTSISNLNTFTASQSTSSLVDRLNTIESVSGSWITENETGSFLRNLNGAISSSSQLTSSYDTRYTLSGSVQPLPSNLVSSSAQITAFGFISSSATTPAGTISGSSQLTSSFDVRYTQTGSFNTLSSSIDSRLDTLESTIISGSPNYTQVLGNKISNITTTGVIIISGSITTTGNPVQIMVTGDANPTSTGWCRLQLYRGENPIGNIIQVENESNQNVPYCLNIIDTPSAGTHTYSMRTVSGIAGTFEFGEASGPLLTAVELKTNTNITSTNNTFTGTNTFNGVVTIGPGGGSEGGELALAYSPNTTLTGSAANIDVYGNTIRIFEGGGNSRGVHIDLSKTPGGVAGELLWKVSGMVGVGTFVTLDNLKCTVTASGSRGLSIGAVSTSFEADVSGWYTVPGGSGGGSANNITYTTTAAGSAFGWNFGAHGDMVQVNIRDKTNSRFYRVTMMIGASYLSNFISIERLF